MNTYGGNTIEAIKHYISYGITEGRVTNAFNVTSYLNNHFDLRNSFGNDHKGAIQHFVEHGFAEGRGFHFV